MKKISLFLVIVSLFVFTQAYASAAYTFEENFAAIENINVNYQIDIAENSVKLTSTGDGGFRVNDIVYDPNFDPNYIMYLATNNGIYRKISESADFTKLNSATEGKNIVKIIKSPDQNDQLLYALDNEGKLYKSTNNGDTWEQKNSEIIDIQEIIFSPNFAIDGRIYLGTQSKLYFTANGGETWSEIQSDINVKSIAFHSRYSSNSTMYISTEDKVYISQNGGTDLIELASGLSIKELQVPSVSMAESPLFALTNEGELLYIPTNGNSYSSLTESVDEKINSFTLYPNYPAINLIYLALENGSAYSVNAGSSWSSPINELSDQNIEYISYSPLYTGAKVMFAFSGGKLYRTINEGSSWEEYMAGIEESGAVEYLNEGWLESNTLNDELTEDITKATITIEGTSPENTASTYLLTADGSHFEAMESGEEHIFEYPGKDLRYKIILSTSDSAVTPEITKLSISYSTEIIPDEEIPPECLTDEDCETGFVCSDANTCTEPVSTECSGYADIETTDVICPIITYVTEQGIFSGYPEDNTFRPDTAINRAETVKVIVEGFDYVVLEDDGTNQGFSDVILNEWYMSYLKTAKIEGIIAGYPDDTFQPAKTINKVEMLKIFFESAGVDSDNYTLGDDPAPDVSKDEWYAKYVDYALKYDLIDTDANGNVNPNAAMKRIDVADLFYRWE